MFLDNLMRAVLKPKAFE